MRIHNRRDVASSGTERLFLNWAKAGANDKWYEYWTGENPLPCGAPKGGVIGSANGKIIPSIPANGTYIDTVHWITPAGENYENCSQFNYNQWHFCLLARIHDDDVIAHENEQLTDVHPLVRNHNNVAQLNVYLSSAIGDYKSQLSFGNATQNIIGRTICMVPKIVNGTSITDYAEIYLTLDNGLLSSLNTTNLGNLTWVAPNTLRWSGGQPCIPLTLPADSYYTMQVTINFLADHVPDNNNFDFHIVLRNAYGDSILGGEHYRCVRTQGRYFQAVANGATTIVSGQSAYLYADDILESATYEWFDEAGNSVGGGIGCNVNPTQTTTYTLAVTADADGYRAYDQVTVTVQQVGITSISPNPSNGQVTVSYRLAANVASATIQILNTNGQVVGSYPVSGGSSAVTGNVVINTSSMAAGSYTVRLISSGNNIYDNKTLVIR